MKRIFFVAPFPKDQISGGIKTTYYHAHLLREAGLEAYVYFPSGKPEWLKAVPVDKLTCNEFALTKNDVLVLPEVLAGGVLSFLKEDLPCQKVLFCQNQYILYTFRRTMKELQDFGITDIITVSDFSKTELISVMGRHDSVLPVHVIPPLCNEALFFPSRQKELRIFVSGQKWKERLSYMALIQRVFLQKYPEFAHIPWTSLEEMDEKQAAEEMRRSAIFLFLARLEALGLTGLEAMASGCAVAGFHGGGGTEYMTEQNGYWHSPEDIFGLVDSLAHMVRCFLSADEQIWQMIVEGEKTAAHYTTRPVRQACLAFYDYVLSS